MVLTNLGQGFSPGRSPQGTLGNTWGRPWLSRLRMPRHQVGRVRGAGPPATVPGTPPERDLLDVSSFDGETLT